MPSSKRILFSLKDIIWTSLGSRSEFDKLLKSSWEVVSDAGYLKYKLENPLHMKYFEAGPMKISILVLMNRFNKRRAPTLFKMIDEPISPEEFNFTRTKAAETLFHLNFTEIDNCVDCYNGLLAGASVNHLHFHLWYSPHRLYASVCSLRRKKGLPVYQELEFHPVNNFVFEFNSLDDFPSTFERLWKVVEECQRLQIAHNLFAARNSSGFLRVVLWPRRSEYGAKSCMRHLSSESQSDSEPVASFHVAVAELAGMPVVPDFSTADSLTSSVDHFLAIFMKENLEKQLMLRLEQALQNYLETWRYHRVCE